MLAAVEAATGAARRADRRQAGAGHVRRPRATGSAPAATWRSATGSTSTSPARAAPGSTARSCSPAATGRAEAEAAEPRADARRRLARRARAAADLLGCGAAHGPAPALPHRQPQRRPRPRRAAAARRSRRRCGRAGSPFRVERTHSLAHARELARDALDRGRGGRRRWAATGCSARSPASCAAPTACSACCPAGAATTSRASSASARIPSAPATCSRRPRARDRRRRRRRRDLPRASPRPGSTPTSRTSPTPRASRSARLIYVYATLRAPARLAPAPTGRSWSTARRRPSPGYSVAVANSGVFGGGMYLVPGRVARRRPARRRAARAPAPSGATSSSLPQGVQGHARRRARDLTFLRAREVALPRRPPVRRLRRRRPDRGPARHHQGRAARAEGARPVTLLGPKVAAAKAVGRVVRAAGRGGGTSLPGKVLTRLEPHAIGLLARGCAHGSAVISATNGKTTTAAMTASILERTGETLVHNRAGANMAGGVASALADASRRGGRALTGRARAVRGRRVLARARSSRSCAPRALLLGNLFRDQLDRYGELEIIADRWADVVAAHAGAHGARAQRRRPAGRRPRPRPRRRCTSASTTTRSRSPSSSTRPTPSTAAAAATLRVRGDLPRPPRPLRVPELRRPAARARRGRARRRAARHPLRGVHARHARRRGARRAAAARALQRLQRARRRGAVPHARRAARRGRRRAGGGGAGVRARRDGRPRRAARRRSCSSRTRRARTRCCARWRSRASSSTCSACSTTTPPTGATSRGCGTPTGSCWRRPCGG